MSNAADRRMNAVMITTFASISLFQIQGWMNLLFITADVLVLAGKIAVLLGMILAIMHNVYYMRLARTNMFKAIFTLAVNMVSVPPYLLWFTGKGAPAFPITSLMDWFTLATDEIDVAFRSNEKFGIVLFLSSSIYVLMITLFVWSKSQIKKENDTSDEMVKKN